jgi:putative transposase
METLRQWERRYLGRNPEPSAGSLDSQSLKTATPNEDSGFDGNTKIKGRKRPIPVDTLGWIMAVVVTSAATEARLGVVAWLSQYVAEGVKRRRNIWVDGAYPAEWLEAWVRGLKQTHTIDLEATTNTEGKGFHVMPWRWAVERTFAWLLHDRRHRRDDERLTANRAAMIQVSMIRLLLNRWA